MKIKISPGKISGDKIHAIVSKSLAHRLLICAALSYQETQIMCKDSSEDINATVTCLRQLGSLINKDNGIFKVTPIFSQSLTSYKNNPDKAANRRSVTHDEDPAFNENSPLECGESGSTYRFIFPIVCALGGIYTFSLKGRLPERPMEPLFSQLEEKGISIDGKGENLVKISGKLKGGRFTLPGNISSQFISGLIFALPLLEEDSEIHITEKIESLNYIKMTVSAVQQFGIKLVWQNDTILIPGRQKYTAPTGLNVEGDWSNSAFWLCMAAANGQRITCSGLNPHSLQGDREVINILQSFGCKITSDDNSVTVIPTKLKPTVIDASNVPDLVPALAVVAAAVNGSVRIINAERLRLKESDRLAAIAITMKKLGCDIAETDDGLIISSNAHLSGGTVDSWSDHRIVMMAAIASVLCDEAVIIENAQAVAKSYPDFFKDFASLGAQIEIIDKEVTGL